MTPVTAAPTTPAQTEPLAVSLQALGIERSCGGCAVLTAVPRGGFAPYTYSWSDPSLTGPGPHEVCPDQSADYSVRVADTGSEAVELARAPAEATANVSLPCTARTEGDPVQGCEVLMSATLADLVLNPEKLQMQPNNSGTCEKLDNPPPNHQEMGSYVIPKTPIVGGRAYTYAADVLLPLLLGDPIKLSLWGGSDCHLEEKLGDIVIDGREKVRVCFTPSKSYQRLFVLGETPREGAFTFSFSAGATLSICSGCSS